MSGLREKADTSLSIRSFALFAMLITTVHAGIMVFDACSLAAKGCWLQNAAASYSSKKDKQWRLEMINNSMMIKLLQQTQDFYPTLVSNKCETKTNY